MSNITSSIVPNNILVSSLSGAQTLNALTTNVVATTLSQLTDVDLQGVTNGSLLIYDTNEFVSRTLTGAISVDSNGFTSVNSNAITLGTHTTGSYVATLSGTSDQIIATGSGSETANVTLSLPQAIALTSSPTFAGITISGAITNAALTVALDGKQPVGNYAIGGGTAIGSNTGDQDLSTLVPKTTTVNGKALNTNISLNKTDVGLSAVDNTSDANKPVSTAQQTALNLKANLASPTFTGTPAVPTPASSDSSTKIASTAFVKAQGYLTSAPVSSVAGKTGAVTLASADITDATYLNTPGTLVLRHPSGDGVSFSSTLSESTTIAAFNSGAADNRYPYAIVASATGGGGIGGYLSGESNYGAHLTSNTYTGALIESIGGTYHATFGRFGNNHSAIERVRGWFVWFFGTFTGRLKTADITANRDWTLPNVSGTIALTSDIRDANGVATFNAINIASATNTGNYIFTRTIQDYIGDDPVTYNPTVVLTLEGALYNSNTTTITLPARNGTVLLDDEVSYAATNNKIVKRDGSGGIFATNISGSLVEINGGNLSFNREITVQNGAETEIEIASVTLTCVTPGSNGNTITFPAQTGTVALTDNITGTNSGTNTGDQTITLTSDVTGSGTGSFATTIATGAVSLAKMANVASSTIFYRKTSEAGAPEVQTLSTLKTDLGLSGTNSGDQDLTTLVPYTGATADVDLGSRALSAGAITSNGNALATVVDPVRTTLTGNGVLSSFAISGASGLVNPAALIVAIDGAMQEPTVDYGVSGGVVTFTSPLPSGSKAVIISPINTLQVSQMIPADGSVTSAKLANDIEVAGQLTVVGQPALDGLSDNHAMTYGLSEEEYGWIDLPAGFANLASNGGVVTISIIEVAIDTGSSTASFSTARARFAGFFNRSPLAWAGGLARNIPFASRRTRLRAIIDKVTLAGNAYFWFGVWEKNSLTATTDEFDNRGFGTKITATQLIAQTHDGSTLFESSPSSFTLSNTFLLEIDYYQQNLSVKVDGQEVASVSGGCNIDSTAQIHLYGYAPSGGAAGDHARVELKQLRYRITEN